MNAFQIFLLCLVSLLVAGVVIFRGPVGDSLMGDAVMSVEEGQEGNQSHDEAIAKHAETTSEDDEEGAKPTVEVEDDKEEIPAAEIEDDGETPKTEVEEERANVEEIKEESKAKVEDVKEKPKTAKAEDKETTEEAASDDETMEAGVAFCNVSALNYPLQTTVLKYEGPWLAEKDRFQVKMFHHNAGGDFWISRTIIESGGNGDGAFEPWLRRQIYAWFRPTPNQTAIHGRKIPKDPLFLDIGGNIGLHSMFMAGLGIRTHAFEPLYNNFHLLSCSTVANRFEKILYVNNFGLGAEEVKQCMTVDGSNQGNAVILKDEDAPKECPQDKSIHVKTLDKYWNSVLKREQPFAIKMDIQTYEPFAVKGGWEMFKEAPPLLFWLEYSPFGIKDRNIDPAKFLTDILDLGYSWSLAYSGDYKWNNTHASVDDLIGALGPNSTLPNKFDVDILLLHNATLDKFIAGETHWN